MEDKQVLVFNEESINNKDARSHSNRIRSNGIGLGVVVSNILISAHHGSLPHQAISIMGADGLAMQVKFQPQAIAYPAYM